MSWSTRVELRSARKSETDLAVAGRENRRLMTLTVIFIARTCVSYRFIVPQILNPADDGDAVTFTNSFQQKMVFLLL